jgi:hypothetical protein
LDEHRDVSLAVDGWRQGAVGFIECRLLPHDEATSGGGPSRLARTERPRLRVPPLCLQYILERSIKCRGRASVRGVEDARCSAALAAIKRWAKWARWSSEASQGPGRLDEWNE